MKNLLLFAIVLSMLSCQSRQKIDIDVTAGLEQMTDNGYRYTPSTQSFLRGHHWLRDIQKASISLDNNLKGTVEFDFKTNSPENNYIRLSNVPFDHPATRLH